MWCVRYVQGQKFGKHIDDSVEVAPGQITLYTLLIYLSGSGSTTTTSTSSHSNSSSSSSTQTCTGSKGSSKSRSASKKASSAGCGSLMVPNAAQHRPATAVQPLLGGETVFYGKHLQCCLSPRYL